MNGHGRNGVFDQPGCARRDGVQDHVSGFAGDPDQLGRSADGPQVEDTGAAWDQALLPRGRQAGVRVATRSLKCAESLRVLDPDPTG